MSEIILKQLAPRGHLRAAINMSNFLLVTGKEANGDPQGVSPDMAKALAHELGVDIELISFSRPGELADAVFEDKWDIGNIANEPERAKSINFSFPYTLIESTFLVRKHLNLNTIKDIDNEDLSNESIEKELESENLENSNGSEENIGNPTYEELFDKNEELEKALLRKNADIDNAMKRTLLEVEKAHKYGTEKLLQELLPIKPSCFFLSFSIETASCFSGLNSSFSG